MAGFNVNPQPFVVVEQMTQGLLSGDVSGIMGLAFEALASTRATPFWQTLVNNNQFANPEISFWLERHLDDQSAQDEESGGVMTLGGTNSSLFTGDIEFNTLSTSSGTPTFWMLEMTGAGAERRARFPRLCPAALTMRDLRFPQVRRCRATRCRSPPAALRSPPSTPARRSSVGPRTPCRPSGPPSMARKR